MAAMEEKKFENKLDLSVALREIQAMLRVENEHWLKSDNSATAKRIQQYDVAIDMLIDFINERNFFGFLLTFQDYQLTVVGIRSCFRSSGPQVKVVRNRAHRLLRNVFLKMLSIMKMEEIKKRAATMTNIDIKKVEEFCEMQFKEAEQGMKEDEEDIYGGMFS